MSERLFEFEILPISCALGCGRNAGIFFAFSSFVMKALARLPSAQGIAAMNWIKWSWSDSSIRDGALRHTAAACPSSVVWSG